MCWPGGGGVSRRRACTSPLTTLFLASSRCRFCFGRASASCATCCSTAAASSGQGCAAAGATAGAAASVAADAAADAVGALFACPNGGSGSRRQQARLHAGHSASACLRASSGPAAVMCCDASALAAAQAVLSVLLLLPPSADPAGTAATLLGRPPLLMQLLLAALLMPPAPGLPGKCCCSRQPNVVYTSRMPCSQSHGHQGLEHCRWGKQPLQ